MKRSSYALGLTIALTSVASADTILDTFPDWDGNVTNGWQRIAQSFTAPNDIILDNYTFVLDPAGGQNTVKFDVFAWNDAVGPVGNSLFTSVEAWPANGGNVFVDNINLALTPGNLYGAVVDLQGYTGASVHWQTNQNSYNAGDASWYSNGWQYLNSGWNTTFRAVFTPEPASIVLLGLGAVVLIRRRRNASA